MPLSLEDATKRFENYSNNIQDSILIMESFMGSHNSFSFNLPQVITNLESVDITAELKNVSAYVKVMEEYQKMLVTERKRRAIKDVIEGKEQSAEFKANLKKKRRSQRLGTFKPNVLPAMAMASQIPPRMPPPNPTSQIPPPNPASQMPPPNPASQMPPEMPPPNAANQMPMPNAEEVPSQDELMLEL